MANELARSTSPYLLQHKDNPVHWQQWGPHAFAEAAQRNVPVLISVGYAACHWCHVMAHESFEDVHVAEFLNAHFVAIKVDREERPDVDSVYMAATQALTGHGGWPMTVFTTPQGEPFYAGTYFPPEPRHGMPSFGQLLSAISDSWAEDPARVVAAAGRITASLRTQLASSAPTGVEVVEPEQMAAALDAGVTTLARSYDWTNGGFGGAPKFPPSMVVEFLLRNHARTGDPRALQMAEGTCEAMARGGMYDQLAGGFARYSVDAEWVVPHFEKMLYDNALLLRTYLHLWRATASPLAERIVRETAQFLLADLLTSEGAFASALDADTDGEEGLTYVWTPAQLIAELGPDDGLWASEVFDVTGTFEHGTSVLQLHDDPQDRDRWSRIRTQLHAARNARPQPGCDDKVVAAWNGLAITALAEAGALFGQEQWVEAATRCAKHLADVHIDDAHRLRRVSRAGVCGQHMGVLEDYANVAEGLLALHQVTGQAHWLSRAGSLLDVVLEQFADAHSGGFFDTAHDAEALVVRPQDPTDNATPSGWSAAANALLCYAALTGSGRHRLAAESALAVVATLAPSHPRFAGWGMAVAEAWLAGPLEIAVVGDDANLRRAALLSTSAGSVLSAGSADAEGVPLLAGRRLVQGAAAAYVCRHFTCQAPVTDAHDLAAALGARVDLLIRPLAYPQDEKM